MIQGGTPGHELIPSMLKKDHPDGWKSRQSLGVRRRTQFGGREIAGKIMWEIVKLEILTERLTYRDDEHYYYQ